MLFDFEKACDSVSWKLISETLEYSNFGKLIKSGIAVFYNNMT